MTTITNYLEVVSAIKRGERTNWTRIGTAFPTKDGRGYRLKINLIPLGTNPEILMLPPKSEAAKPESEGR